MCTARLSDAGQGKRDKGARDSREQKPGHVDRNTRIMGLAIAGVSRPAGTTRDWIIRHQEGFDLGYRVGGKFEGERDCPLIIYPRDEVENSDRTRSGILPGRRKQPSSRAQSSAERRRCLKSSPLLLWMLLQPCVSGRTTIFAIHYECIQDRVGEETSGISQEKIERFLSHRILEVLLYERRKNFIHSSKYRICFGLIYI